MKNQTEIFISNRLLVYRMSIYIKAIARDFGTAQMHLLNAIADVSSKARGLISDPNLHLHPYFVFASSEGSCESARMR